MKRITVADRPFDNPYETSSYRFQLSDDDGRGTPLTEMPLNSFICAPSDRADVAGGEVRVTGYAIGRGMAPVRSVEVTADDATWQAATLLDAPVAGAWVRWAVTLTLDAGKHVISVRATDASGTAQPADLAARWNVRGYANDAWHRIAVFAHHPTADDKSESPISGAAVPVPATHT